MQLMMFVDNDCIDSIVIESNLLTTPGYVRHFVRLLKRKNEEVLLQLNGEPEFLLHGVPTQIRTQVIQMKPVYLEDLDRSELMKAG